MDAARYADMSDPERNPNFRRKWTPPPLKRERPPTGGTVERARIEYDNSSKNEYSEFLIRVQAELRGAL